jgi:hypothetical protein
MADEKVQWDKSFIRTERTYLKDQIEHVNSVFDNGQPLQDGDTVVIRYWMVCGNPDSGLPLKSHTFLQPAPRFICNPIADTSMYEELSKEIGDLPVKMQNLLDFSKDLFEKYSGGAFYSQSWSCVKCDKSAQSCHISTRHFLSPKSAINTAGFIPMVLAVAIPVCPSFENEGECSNTAVVMDQNFGLEVLARNPWKIWDQMKTCQKCGSTANVKFCGGCKLIG